MDQKAEQQRHCYPDKSFEFAFDNPAFSDRTLNLMIFPDPAENNEIGNGNENSVETTDQAKLLRPMNQDIPKLDAEFKVNKLRINSVILAARSTFFHKLFTSGMKECEQSEADLQICASEESSLIDVIKFMYSSNLLSARSPIALLNVIITADKYNVPLCVSYCCELLQAIPLSLEVAFSIIDLPSSVLNVDEVQQLLDVARNFIFTNLCDISKCRHHIMNLSLDGFKNFLPSDDLKVDTEDVAYDLFVEWLEVQYTDLEQRSAVFNSELCNLIRVQLLSPQKLKGVLTSTSTLNNVMLDIITPSKYDVSRSRRHRAYNLPPVALISFDTPIKQYEAHLDLLRKEFDNMRIIKSQTFVLGDLTFYLRVDRDIRKSSGGTFGFYLVSKEIKQPVKVVYEFSAMTETCELGFVRLSDRITSTFQKGVDVGYGLNDLFKEPWESVMAKDSNYFINDTMHLKVAIAIHDQKQ